MRYKYIIPVFFTVVFLLSSCAQVGRLVNSGKPGIHKSMATQFSPDATMEANIGQPVTGKTAVNLRKKVASDMRMVQKLKGIDVSSVREGEVIRITLPASVLFEPNDSVLWGRAALTLRPLIRYADPSLYGRLVVAGYMDDTGSSAYTQRLSAVRAEAVARWFRAEGRPGVRIITYAFGSRDPLYPNISEVNRSRNRRIVLYLIPDEEMLVKARRGKFGQ